MKLAEKKLEQFEPKNGAENAPPKKVKNYQK